MSLPQAVALERPVHYASAYSPAGQLLNRLLGRTNFMPRILTSTLAGLILLGTANAQTSAQASGSENTSVSTNQGTAASSNSANVSKSGSTAASQVQSGSTVHAELAKPVDVRKNKPGDEVVAKTTQDVKSNGKVVIPRGSKIVGHVTEAKARAKGQQDSSLGLAFDHAVLKDGTTVPVTFAVQAIGNSSAAAQDTDESLMSSGGGMAAGSASSVRSTGGGLIGGVGSTAGAVTNTAVGTTGSVGGALSAPLSASSQGAVGMPNFNLATAATNSTSSTITSNTSNVRLDSGTEMILRANQ
jgi:hypothetical protein